MGKRSTRQKSVAVFDSDDESVGTSSTSTSDITTIQEGEEVYGRENLLESCLDALYEKRGSTREKALSGIINSFTLQMQTEFAENNFITLQHHFAKSIKRGSSGEAALASRALGLLAITIGAGDSTHEIMVESLPHLSQALKSGLDSQKRASVLECLAILTFVGGNACEETQRSMQTIWQLIHPKHGSNVGVGCKLTGNLLAVAVSAWAFLLTSTGELRMNANEWQESITFLSTLLDKDDRVVRMAAGEAIALIFEICCLEKYSRAKKYLDDEYSNEGEAPKGVFMHVEAMKGKIMNQVRQLSAEAGGKRSTKKDLNNQRNLFRDIQAFLETGCCADTSIKLQYGDLLVVSTWAQLVQMNFLKRFLGSGFFKHMQENDLLHEVFDFNPRKHAGKYGSSLFGNSKRAFKSPNSATSKARTQFLNKQRMLAQGRNYEAVWTSE